MERSSQEGRNLGAEIDEMKERLNKVMETQTRIEEVLQAIKDALDLLGMNRIMGGMRINTTTPVTSTMMTTSPFTPQYSQTPPYIPNPYPPRQTQPAFSPPTRTNPAPSPQIYNTPLPPYVPIQNTYTHHPPALFQDKSYQSQPRASFQGRARPQNLPPFPSLSIPKEDLFQRLIDAHLISRKSVPPREPPFPTWYDFNVTCKYHMDARGHSLESCEAFKTEVRRLIAYGDLDIQEKLDLVLSNNSTTGKEPNKCNGDG